MKTGASKGARGSRPQPWWPFLALAVLLLGIGGSEAFAQAGFEVDRTMDEAKGVGIILLGLIFLAYVVVGGIVILSALSAARDGRTGWGHFLMALGAVVVAGFVLWTLTTMTGHNPQKITEKIQIK